jgi:hypothetical protein
MPLNADDGNHLEVKEGIVLDRDGNPLTPPPHRHWRAASGPQGHVFVWRGSGWLSPLIMLPVLGLIATLVLTLMGGFVAVAVLVWILFLFRRLLNRLT